MITLGDVIITQIRLCSSLAVSYRLNAVTLSGNSERALLSPAAAKSHTVFSKWKGLVCSVLEGDCGFVSNLKIVVKSHFLSIGGIYTLELHPRGSSAPRKQAEAVSRGVKDKKAGKKCFPLRFVLTICYLNVHC